MTAKEARQKTEEIQLQHKENLKREEKKKVEREKQFKEDLKTKYPNNLIKEKINPEIEKLSNQGINNLKIKTDFNDEYGEIEAIYIKELLIQQGFRVNISSTFIPEYKQTSHFDEGDYSHSAYTKWIIEIFW
jgi:hypothetical protein